MKQFYFFSLLISLTCFGQQAYYGSSPDAINFNNPSLTGQNLYNALQQKISHYTTSYTYGDVRDDLKIMDLDPTNAANVLLVYGYTNNSSCTSGVTDRRIRNKDDFGGNNCEYNREHVFSRSNANPSMSVSGNSTTGIGADPHNLRAADVQRNSNRGNRKFAAGTGNSGVLGSGNWYPGDEWRGDVARIMMYMYVRYGNRCLPELNASGTKQGTTNMLQILLDWNASDPVSDIEDNRNARLETVYGNRNPFIDNPHLATRIWGGTTAQDRWGIFNIEEQQTVDFKISPNPAKDHFYVTLPNQISTRVEIYDVLGKRIFVRKINESIRIDVNHLKSGVYVVKFIQGNKSVAKKLVKQ